MDYKKLGLKAGLEFHQRLDTHKLFCNCSSVLEENPSVEFTRRLRPTASELGKVDPAALNEFLSKKTFNYQGFENSVCLVEQDEEPPHEVNKQALEIALKIGLMLDMNFFDQVQVMRKTVIDGSNTAGFQRTMMLGHNGELKTPYGEVGILGIFLEEESSGIVGEKGKAAYRLDRLGIPLIEIATDLIPEPTPEKVKDVALYLGSLLRTTRQVQRGQGTIRQDVNISIKDGARVELKGVQDIRMLEQVIEFEVQRQLKLLELKDEMKKRKLEKPKVKPIDVTEIFRDTKNEFIKKAIHSNGVVKLLVLKNYKGVIGAELNPNRRFGSELGDYAKAVGVGGIIHTDENLGKYKIQNEVLEIVAKNKLEESDAFILIAESEDKVDNAFNAISKRIGAAFSEIPNETRNVMPDGVSMYMRPLAGASRMYPETDISYVNITQKMLGELKKQLPKTPEQISAELEKKHRLSKQLAGIMMLSKNYELFESLVGKGHDARLVAPTLEYTLTELRRQGVDVEVFTEAHFDALFKALKENKFAKEAIPKVLAAWASKPHYNIVQVIEEAGLGGVSEKEIRDYAVGAMKKIDTSGPRAFNMLMGDLMKKYRGKADGALIARESLT